jgi:hypothetical protein
MSLFIILSCNRLIASTEKHPFNLIEATSQEIIAGVRGGGKSITYKISLLITQPVSISVDSIWINNKRLKLTIAEGSQLQSSGSFTPQDTLILLASDYLHLVVTPGKRQEERQAVSDEKVPAPMAYKGAALLRYFMHDKEKFFELSQFQALPTIYGH